MKLFVKGDFEGFFTLGVDNMVVFILMSSLCLGVLGYSNELFFYRILPATSATIDQTWVDGKVLYKDNAVQTLDESSLRDEARQRAVEIIARADLQRLGIPTTTRMYD